MKYKIHHLHLEQYFIQQKHDKNFRDLCYYLCASNLIEIYSLGTKEYTTFNIS